MKKNHNWVYDDTTYTYSDRHVNRKRCAACGVNASAVVARIKDQRVVVIKRPTWSFGNDDQGHYVSCGGHCHGKEKQTAAEKLIEKATRGGGITMNDYWDAIYGG